MISRILLSALLVLAPLSIASWSVGQDVDDAACNRTIQTSCTKCHSTERICHELGESEADWPEIIKEMGELGNLSREVQDAALTCLTRSSDPKKFVCTK